MSDSLGESQYVPLLQACAGQPLWATTVLDFLLSAWVNVLPVQNPKPPADAYHVDQWLLMHRTAHFLDCLELRIGRGMLKDKEQVRAYLSIHPDVW